MTNTNRSYSHTNEEPYTRERGESLALNIYPPLIASSLRRGSGGRRTASYYRHQLVCIAVDTSRSMEGWKAKAATEAVQETVYGCKMKSNGDSIFDFSLLWFGDYVFSDESLLLKPVQEIDEDKIEFLGDSGGTRIKQAVKCVANLIEKYDEHNLAHNPEKDRVPPPLIIFMSDGKNGDGDPLPITNKLKTTPLSIGVPPIVITVGIEFDGGEPDIELLTAMASETEHGQKLYFDIASAGQLVEYLATGASSGASTPDEFYRSIVQTEAWQKRLPNPEK
ncbi:vWA domain-containing protein [Botrimarina sp.]|uniref:vWA domain-containing protein n=1 Tax=Botrimarina sp. TaxID=2795802 RepID=UPI0032EF0794